MGFYLFFPLRKREKEKEQGKRSKESGFLPVLPPFILSRNDPILVGGQKRLQGRRFKRVARPKKTPERRRWVARRVKVVRIQPFLV